MCGTFVWLDSAMTSEQGWGSWAWSYVPQLLPSDSEDDDDDDVTRNHGARHRKREPPILAIGAYCRKASFMFKASYKKETNGNK